MYALRFLAMVALATACYPVYAKNPARDQLSPEQRQLRDQQQLENSSIGIDHDCQPSTATKMNWAISPKSVQKHFWKGQQYALERYLQERTNRNSYFDARRQLAAEQAALDRRSSELTLSYGDPSGKVVQKSREISEKIDAGRVERDAKLQQLRERSDKSLVEWYWRCKAYVQERIRELE